MLQTLKYFLSRVYTITSIVLFALSYGAIQAYAVYYPTDNITNPTCAPGDSGCYVSLLPDQTSKSGSLLFTNGTNPSWTGSSALSWDSVNGRLGVGTSIPTSVLEVASESTTASRGIIVRNANTASSNGSPIRFQKSRGTLAAPEDLQDGDTISSYIASPYSGGTYFSTGELDFEVDGTFTSGQRPPSRMVVYTNIANGAQIAAMTIKGNGNVGIGTTNPGHKLTVGDGTGNNFISVANSSSNIYLGQSGNTRFGYAGGTIGLLLQSATDIAMGIGTFGGDAPLIFGTNNIERMRISGASGNIGVGTTTPLSRFHIGVSPTASANYGTISLGGGAFDGTTSGYFGTSSSSNSNGTSLAINEASGYTGDLINAQVGGSSNFVVTGDNKTYFGRSPSSVNASLSGAFIKANILGEDGNTGLTMVRAQGNVSGPYVYMVKARGTLASPSDYVSGDTIGSITSNAYYNGGIRTATNIYSIARGNSGNSVMGEINFLVQTATNNETLMSIQGATGSGNVTIGSAASAITPLGRLHIKGVTADSTANALYVENSSSTNLLTVRNDGNIGIGTNSPLSNLHIYTAASNTPQGIALDQGGGNSGRLFFMTNGGPGYDIYYNGVSDALYFAAGGTPGVTSGSTRMNISGDGRLTVNNGATVGAYSLNVGSSSVTGIVSRFQNSTGTCDINPTTTSLSCSSDRTLKTNITNLNNTILNQITTLQPVTYTWINDNTNQQQTGFIAQDVEAIFPSLVSTDPTTNLKSLNYIGLIPYAIEGIRELDIKLNQQASLDTTLQGSFGYLAKEFLGNISNSINDLYAKVIHSDRVETKELCIDDLCITKNQLQQILNQTNQQNVSNTDNSTLTIPEEIIEEPVIINDTPPSENIDILE